MKSRLPGFGFDSKKGVAHFEVVVPGTNGITRKRKTFAVRDLSEATSKYHEFRKDVLGGRRTEPWTFAEYVADRSPALQGRLADSASRREKQFLANQVIPFLGAVRMEKVNASLVKDFIAKLKADGLHPTTINNAFAVVRKYLRDAWHRGEIREYPIRENPRVFRQHEEPLSLELTREERVRFLGVFDDEKAFREYHAAERARGKVSRIQEWREKKASAPLRGGGWDPLGESVGWHFERFRESKPIFIVALETGLSKSDLLGLRWSDVDQVNGWIRVVRKKTGRMSKIKFSTELRAALLTCHRKDVTAEFVFLTEDDRPEERQGRKHQAGQPAWRRFPEVRLLRYFAIAKALAGIKRRFRFHDLRHSFGSFHASAGTPLQVIQGMMGHADIKTTARYAKPDEAAIEQAVRELEEKRGRS
jgi:integrase